MLDSEDENENFCYFGKPLESYDEDSFPKKRPISVEEQIATDAQGRRRFHGAFTGGFSAGFFNTVGSLEGWTPTEFKSSRLEKTKAYSQKPEDFMDEEDIGEHGIAPQVVRATSDYSTSKKRKRQVFPEGPIPGEPVLHNILSSGNETVGYMLLKNLGIKDKLKQQQEGETVFEEKVYGCQMPKPYQISQDIHYNQHEIPEIYKEFLAKPKDNTFGLGYVGLNKSQFSFFPSQSAKFVVTGRNNEKLSITGKAFGVGAFEEDDDDIYMREDMTRYDFELTGEKSQSKPTKDPKNLVYDMFVRSNAPLLNKILYPPPQIPHSFTGKYKVRRSRFEPIPEEILPNISKINPTIRARYLGEETDKQHTSETTKQYKSEKKSLEMTSQNPDSRKETFDTASLYLNDKFVSSSKEEDIGNILEPVEKMVTTHGTEQLREAARMKMFGPLTRITSDWVPCSLLCKRFNVPEPFVDCPDKPRIRTKNLIFEYQKHIEEDCNLKPGLSTQNKEIDEEQGKKSDRNDTIEFKMRTEEIQKNDDPPLNDTESKVNDSDATEKVIMDIVEKIDLEKQQDLFKAVFLSSSDSESEKEEDTHVEDKQVSRTEELKSAVLSDQLIPKIKPMKEGILSGVNFHKFTKPTSVATNEDKEVSNLEKGTVDLTRGEESKPLPPDPCLYGPKSPEKIFRKDGIDIINVFGESGDEWVEKDSTKMKKKKRHKKEKKHKRNKRKEQNHDGKKIKHKE